MHFRAAAWSPLAGFWHGRTLTGVELIVTDGRAFRAVRTAVEILVAVRAIAPGSIVLHETSLDRDWGTDLLRRGLSEGLDADAVLSQWEPQTHAFEALRQRYLLYT